MRNRRNSTTPQELHRNRAKVFSSWLKEELGTLLFIMPTERMPKSQAYTHCLEM